MSRTFCLPLSHSASLSLSFAVMSHSWANVINYCLNDIFTSVSWLLNVARFKMCSQNITMKIERVYKCFRQCSDVVICSLIHSLLFGYILSRKFVFVSKFVVFSTFPFARWTVISTNCITSGANESNTDMALQKEMKLNSEKWKRRKSSI